MPRISPARTASETSRSAVPECRDVEMPSRVSTAAPGVDGPLAGGTISWPHISCAISADVRVGRIVDAAGDPAMPQHRAAMRERPHLVQLVRDEDDAEALAPPSSAARENSPSTSVGASTAVGSSRISNLAPRNSALTISSRCCSPTDSAETGKSGSSVSPCSTADLGQPRKPAGAIDAAGSCRNADQKVFQHRQPWRQMKMLVHHADAGGQRIGRTGDPHRLALDQDLAGIRRIGAEQHIHQRRLAGAVLAEQPEDFTRRDAEIDGLVRLDGAEALGDAAHFDERGGQGCS